MNSSPKQKSAAGFPKSARLLKHADFERVYQEGRRHFSPSMTVFFLEREVAGGPRIGLTVGKVLGGAVTRNRIKRRVREAVRRHLLLLTAKVDVVINPKKSASVIESAKLEAEVERAFAAVQQGKGAITPSRAKAARAGDPDEKQAASQTPRRPRLRAKSR